jgi:hypothetical protein
LLAALYPVVHEVAIEVLGLFVVRSLVITGTSASLLGIAGNLLGASVVSFAVATSSVIEILGAFSETFVSGSVSSSVTESSASSVASSVTSSFVFSHGLVLIEI